MRPKFKPLLLAIYMAASGCDSGSGPENGPIMADNTPVVISPAVADKNLAVPDNTLVTKYNVLFMGNSHVVGLATLLRTIIETGAQQKNIGKLTLSIGDFLAERLNDARSIDTLKNASWSHVIFQAQKYSQSGRVDYPTDAAQTWINLAKSQNAIPILFPEHPQRGNSQEGQQVHNLHVSIANIQSSCVAPVGLVWDRVIRLMPNVGLHLADGNHASNTEKFLTALVFYETITGLSADLIPFLGSIDIDMVTQDLFGQIVSEVMAEYPPCDY
jgi:hypothetical protein